MTGSPTQASDGTAGSEAERSAAAAGAEPQAPDRPPGFGERGRMRRRARFLRKARELAFRDLGGLVFDIHRFGERNDRVLAGKLATLRQIDTELRALEVALRERRPVTVLREAGIAACPRCAAIHGADDRFCPGCGLAFDAHADRPLATAPIKIPQAPTSAEEASAFASQSYGAHAAGAPTPTAPTATPSLPPAPAATPPVKPTAPPVPARPGSDQAARPDSERPPQPDAEQGRPGPDEPTQILRPPASGA